MDYEAGDMIKVEIPAGTRARTEVRYGIVKIVGPRTGRITWYCDPSEDTCGYCGPDIGQGGHRLGMSGSMIVG